MNEENTESCLVIAATFYRKPTREILSVLIYDYPQTGGGETSLEAIQIDAGPQITHALGEGFIAISYEASHEYLECEQDETGCCHVHFESPVKLP